MAVFEQDPDDPTGDTVGDPATDPADHEWAIAAGTPIWPRDQAVVDALPRRHRPGEVAGPVAGVVVAERHPTGWFIHGVHAAGLSPGEVGDFVRLVTVRVFLLLSQGPRPAAWRPTPSGREWHAVSSVRHPGRLGEVVRVPTIR